MTYFKPKWTRVLFDNLSAVAVFLSLVFTTALIYWHHNDQAYAHNLTIFSLWFVNLLVIAILVSAKICFPRNSASKISITYSEPSFTTILFAITFVLVVATRFVVLKEYPYVAVGDELRDAGLNALYIKQGVTKDLFGFGSYNGYGNIIPAISSLFLQPTSNSNLVYRLPSSIVGLLSLVLIYFVGYKLVDRKTGLISFLLLSGSIIHLHFSRTELLVIMDSLMAVVALGTTYLSRKYHYRGTFLFGLACGFCLHLYAGVRGVFLACVLYLFIYHVRKLLISFDKNTVIKSIIICASIISGIVIGSGPKLNNLNRDNLSGTGNAAFIFTKPEYTSKPIQEKLNMLKSIMFKSLSVTIVEPTRGPHFKYYAPLAGFGLGWLTILGLLVLFCRKNPYRFLLLFVTITPLITNQLFIGIVGDEHRLMSVVPLLILITAVGLSWLSSQKPKVSLPIVGLVLVYYLASQWVFYFCKRPSDYERGVKEYQLQNLVDYFSHFENNSSVFILNEKASYFDTWHHREKITFYAYPRNWEYLDNITFFTRLYASCQKQPPQYFFTLDDIQNTDTYRVESIRTYCLSKSANNDYRCPIGWLGVYGFSLVTPICN